MSDETRTWNFDETLRRELATDIRADAEKRTVELSFSSELAVDRGGYMEVLSHEDEDMDLKRLNDSHPLLLNHDPEKQCGVVERAWCDKADKKGRAVVRFSQSQLGQEIWKDVQDGIRRLVSVGYRRTKEVGMAKDGNRDVVRFAWQPYEVSIVSVPADASVGIGRNQPTEEAEPKKDLIIMSETATRDFKKENAEILAIANTLADRVDNIRDLAMAALANQETPDQFRATVLNKLPQGKPLEKSVLADVPVRDWAKYSITRAIQGQITGRMDGFEAEMHQELSKRTGQKAEGFWLPSEAMVYQRNAIAGTGTLGGMVVSTPNLGSEFIDLLRARTVAGQMGVKMLTLQNPVTIPRQAGATTANWINGETAAATLSGVNFTQLTLSPKVISAVAQYSKQLLMTSNPSIDALLRDDITQQIAIAIDLAVLHGTGATGQPAGITATTGIATVAMGTNGAALSTANAYGAFVSLETELATDHADLGSLGYVINAKTRGKLKTIGKSGLDSVFVWEPGGTINGYKVGVSNQISEILTKGTATTICSACFFGNWADILVAEFNGGATDMVVDPYSLSLYGVVRLVARKWLDLGVRHPESFSVLLDVIN